MAKSTAEKKPTAKCPVSNKDYIEGAKQFALQIGMGSVIVEPKEFSSGSVGFFGTGKTTIDIDGVPVKHQVTINIVAVGSKPGEE